MAHIVRSTTRRYRPQATGRFDAAVGNAGDDLPMLQPVARVVEVVTFVGVPDQEFKR
ncbi:hypothetical protein [Streptomyces sp. NBC_01361]|uniref:hypothetical protein n=1 Tax=Streptomyces sp. NBC_01361 TaxID=2903838 RepID=UPI003FCE82B0